MTCSVKSARRTERDAKGASRALVIREPVHLEAVEVVRKVAGRALRRVRRRAEVRQREVWRQRPAQTDTCWNIAAAELPLAAGSHFELALYGSRELCVDGMSTVDMVGGVSRPRGVALSLLQ